MELSPQHLSFEYSPPSGRALVRVEADIKVADQTGIGCSSRAVWVHSVATYSTSSSAFRIFLQAPDTVALFDEIERRAVTTI